MENGLNEVFLLRDDVSIYCPRCKSIIGEGNFTIITTYDYGNRLNCVYVCEEITSTCCKVRFIAPFLFDNAEHRNRCALDVMRRFKNKTPRQIHKALLRKKVSRKMRNRIRSDFKIDSYNCDGALNGSQSDDQFREEFDKELIDKLRSNPMFFETYPEDNFGNLTH